MVSIIIPVYNAQDYISECLNSILTQSDCDIEVVLVNDGSTDASGDICDKYSSDDRVKVFHRENSGVSSSRNFGIDHASGDYIMFVDADDTIAPNMLKLNLNILEKTNADVVVYGFTYRINDGQKIIENKLSEFIGDKRGFFYEKYIDLLNEEALNPPWNKIIRKKIIDNANIRFDERFSICEDMIFTTDVLNNCETIAISSNLGYVYNLKETGSLVTKYHDNFCQAATTFCEKTLDYCSHFENNKLQKEAVLYRYACLMIGQLKRVSCNERLGIKQKLDRVKDICGNSLLCNALRECAFYGKKAVVKWAILHKWWLIICVGYFIRNKLAVIWDKGPIEKIKKTI